MDGHGSQSPRLLRVEHVVAGSAAEFVGPAAGPQLACAPAIGLIGSPEYALAQVAPSPVSLVIGTCEAVVHAVIGCAADVVLADLDHTVDDDARIGRARAIGYTRPQNSNWQLLHQAQPFCRLELGDSPLKTE